MEPIDHVAQDQVSVIVDDYEAAAYESDCESSSFGNSEPEFREFTGNGLMARLDEGGELSAIKQSFLAGMGLLIGKEINVVAVHKHSPANAAARGKTEVFGIFSTAVAAKRGGDANVKTGWYGGSKEEIRDVVAYGFGKCAGFHEGFSHGVGVYLSPENVPLDSAWRAEEDENGVRHILLCRVILGNPETIRPGSQQFQPSSTHFDSGIDNPVAPRKYIIWSAFMNSHILPIYIVSFTVNSITGRVSSLAKNPSSLNPKLVVLLNLLSRFLDPSIMGLIWNYYKEYRENRIDKSRLIINLRSLAGDSLLSSAIKMCTDQSGRTTQIVTHRRSWEKYGLDGKI